jgi:hypothetical protein
MIAGPPYIQRLHIGEDKLAEIKPIHKSINGAYRIVVGDIIIEQRWKQSALLTIDTFNEPGHDAPADSFGKVTTIRQHFHTGWALSSKWVSACS